MNQKSSVVLIVCLICSMLGCQSQSKPGASTDLKIRPLTYDVRAFGAIGDGKALDSPAINQAIEHVNSAGGGTIYFPAGTYRCFSIRLKSNICLFLDPAATILAADNPLDENAPGYDVPEPNQWDAYEDFGHSHWHNSLIWGENLENIAIVGLGRIDGKGLTSGPNPRRRNNGGRGGAGASINQGPRRNTNDMQVNDPLPTDLNPTTNSATTAASASTSPADNGVQDRSPASRPGRTPFGYPGRDALPPGIGNKSIALKLCRNVTLRDFTLFRAGHFGILATGVDNCTMDNVKIDTNRDGVDWDCCRNIRMSNCSINSPNDDGICPKSSYALGEIRPCENITITNCQVSGWGMGSFLDGTYKQSNRGPGIGRIKFGTESNGGFKNITISNCVFAYCRGLALETVDGALLEDVTIDNITMRDVAQSPIFMRLGARLRGPDSPPVGELRRIKISNIICYGGSEQYASIISGVPGHDIQDITISNVRIYSKGGGTRAQATSQPAENEGKYPEPNMFGTSPAYAFYIRHVNGIELRDVEVSYLKPDLRSAFVLDDVKNIEFNHVKAQHAEDVPTVLLKGVKNLLTHHCPWIEDGTKESMDQGKL